MSALGHFLETAGIATTGISLVREHSARMAPPRALWVPFELGRPFGAPGDAAFQHRVLGAALALLVDAYEEEPDKDEVRVVLKFHPDIAPVQVAVLPLSRKAELLGCAAAPGTPGTAAAASAPCPAVLFGGSYGGMQAAWHVMSDFKARGPVALADFNKWIAAGPLRSGQSEDADQRR